MTMNLTTLTNGEPWMPPEERDLNNEFIQSTTKLLETRGVPETPLILIRVNDVIATWLLARRLESALAPEPGEPAPCPTPAQAGAIGKCRERLRRAIKELEACCPRDAAPISQSHSYIEKMHEAVREVRASGILDEPAAGERNRNHTPHPTHTTHNPPKPHPNQITSPEPPQNHVPAENHPNPHPASDPTETRSSNATPSPPRDNPTPPTPPPNRKARRLLAREERRNRTGPSKTAPMGTYPRTTPQVERHPRAASTQNEENGSGTQRGGRSRPG